MIRALLRTTEVKASLVAYALTAIVCAVLPLADHVGFEFATALTLVSAAVAPFIGFAAMRLERTVTAEHRRPARAAAFAGGFAVASLAVPVALILLNGVRRPLCDPASGAIWLLVLPAPTAWLAATLGALARLVIDRVRWAVVAVVVVECATVGTTIATTYAGPAVFAFDHFGGYFPGPYSGGPIPFPAALLSFRVVTLLWGAAAIVAAGAFGSAGGAVRRTHTGWAIALCAALITVSAGWGSDIGWRTTDRALRAALAGEITINRLVLHFPRTFTDRQVELLVRDATYVAAQVERVLGIVPTDSVHVWMYGTALEKRRLVGAEFTQFSKPYRHEIHIQEGGYPHYSLRHELIHAMAAEFASGPFRVPGRPIPNSALIEGFATAYSLDHESLTLAQEAKAMRDVKLAPDLERLLGPAGFIGESSNRAYTYSGAFIRYLDARFGIVSMRALYRAGDLAALGDPRALVRDFERMLDSVPADANARSAATRDNVTPGLFKRRCAREVGALVDSAYALAGNRRWSESLAMFDRVCALQPDDPALLSGKLTIAIWMKPAGVAPILAIAESLWRHPHLDPGLEAASRSTLGDELWRRGDVAAAHAEYVRAAALPADPATRRTSTVRLRTLADSTSAELLAPLFTGTNVGLTQTLRMSDALATRPTDALLLYLLARQYHQRGGSDKAAELMERADAVGLGDAEMTRENLRSLVVARAERNKCDAAERALLRFKAAGGSESSVGVATDWVARCRFAVARGWKPLD